VIDPLALGSATAIPFHTLIETFNTSSRHRRTIDGALSHSALKKEGDKDDAPFTRWAEPCPG